MVREGQKTEQMRNAIQALPWSCVLQHWVDFSSRSVMLKELASTAVRKVDNPTTVTKEQTWSEDEGKNCPPLFPGQAKSGTC